MSETTPGHSESSPLPQPTQTVQQKVDKLDESLDEYEDGLGIPDACPTTTVNEVRRLLALEPQVLSKMTEVQCGEASVMLKLFAIYLQKAANREQARVRWAQECVLAMVAARLPQMRSSWHEERKQLAIRENDAAQKLEAVRVKAQLRLDRVSYQAGKVNALAESLERLQHAKRRFET